MCYVVRSTTTRNFTPLRVFVHFNQNLIATEEHHLSFTEQRILSKLLQLMLYTHFKLNCATKWSKESTLFTKWIIEIETKCFVVDETKTIVCNRFPLRALITN